VHGQPVGELTSAGYSARLGRAIGMGYVRSESLAADEAILSAQFRIDLAGDLQSVTAHVGPLLRTG
jgi:4-methylaminobutanoate oxidase (formaldehyde-forming)